MIFGYLWNDIINKFGWEGTFRATEQVMTQIAFFGNPKTCSLGANVTPKVVYAFKTW